MGKVIYVTGAPATGKSTLCRTLSADPAIHSFCYSERLRDHVNRQAGIALDEADIRRQSAQVVTSKHVDEVDDLLQAEAESCRKSGGNLLIDSHPVTKENYGFRVTPFKLQRLLDLKIDYFICLYADPKVMAQRIELDAQGRPLPSDFELAVHVNLQASVVATYSVLSGRPCHLVDSSVDRMQLVQRVRALAGLI
ncbi:AAA family ATPase [Lysobacter sp. K5869]|uniref:ATP-binding protein n=1 Tax=Lysobacter sp. K5869 TaxID=2820808 RepID=UPI001C06027A|nr:ATP-binding protein [Lysobacter sp. K5869]QWP77204.1 AAA family ATPase [Lysobacter sp. K5869]